MLAALTVLPNQTFKFPSTRVIGLNPLGCLMFIYLSETGLLPVALMLFWLLPYLLNLNHLPLPICNRCSMLDLMDKCAEFMSLTLMEVKYCENTRLGHQMEASNKQHESLCECLQAKQVTLHTILLGGGGSIYTSNTLHHLKELGLDSQRAHKTALKLHAHPVHYAHKLTNKAPSKISN